MVSEEIIGGLISALSRGEPLQQAMMTFYNAGYGKDEIEEAAKIVYTQVGAQTAKTGYLQEAVKTIASKVGLVKKSPKNPSPPSTIVPIQNAKPAEVIQKPTQEKKPNEKEDIEKPKDNFSQGHTNYEQNKYNATYQNAEQITSKIEKAIKELKNINLPSKIEVINRNVDSKSPVVVQRVSHYGGPPKPVSKVVTYVLVFILILLLGVLAAVFFFKEDLIKIFNNLGLS
jgi:hypothetical protein